MIGNIGFSNMKIVYNLNKQRSLSSMHHIQNIFIKWMIMFRFKGAENYGYFI